MEGKEGERFGGNNVWIGKWEGRDLEGRKLERFDGYFL